MEKTDYTRGDAPLEAGTLVRYEDRTWRVMEENQVDGENRSSDPQRHPDLLAAIKRDPEQEQKYRYIFRTAYPDGKGYWLWPVEVPVKFGNRHHSRSWVRRTSLCVVEKKGS